VRRKKCRKIALSDLHLTKLDLYFMKMGGESCSSRLRSSPVQNSSSSWGGRVSPNTCPFSYAPSLFLRQEAPDNKSRLQSHIHAKPVRRFYEHKVDVTAILADCVGWPKPSCSTLDVSFSPSPHRARLLCFCKKKLCKFRRHSGNCESWAKKKKTEETPKLNAWSVHSSRREYSIGFSDAGLRHLDFKLYRDTLTPPSLSPNSSRA